MWTLLKNQWKSVSGNAKWDAIKWSGAFVIAGVVYLLRKIGHIPDWILAASILATALIIFSLSLRAPSLSALKQQSQPSPSQIVTQAVGLEKNIEAVEAYYKKNIGPMMEEVEAHFQRLAAHFTDSKERERFLIRTVSSGALATWQP